MWVTRLQTISSIATEGIYLKWTNRLCNSYWAFTLLFPIISNYRITLCVLFCISIEHAIIFIATYPLYQDEKPSVHLSVHSFRYAGNLALYALIEMGHAQNDSCLFEEHKVHFYKPTEYTTYSSIEVCKRQRCSSL